MSHGIFIFRWRSIFKWRFIWWSMQFHWISQIGAALRYWFSFSLKIREIDVRLSFSIPKESGNGSEFAIKEEIGDAGGFPNPQPYAVASLGMNDYPSLRKTRLDLPSGYRREKKWCWIVDKWRPTGHRSPLAEGGLRSLTKKPWQFSRRGGRIQNAQRQIRDGLHKESKKNVTIQSSHGERTLGKKDLLSWHGRLRNRGQALVGGIKFTAIFTESLVITQQVRNVHQ